MTFDARQVARGLRDLIEEHADLTEEKATIAQPVVDAIAESGLFRLLVPASLGGHEADVDTIVDVFEEISYADGSTGWAVAQNTTVGAYSAYLADEFARPLAAATAAAGMFAPLGVAHEEPGGFRVSGSYKFGSGSGYAEYMGGSALIMRDGDVAPIGDDGSMPVVGFIIPIDRVEMKGNWDVMGLRGTGSDDFDVPEQFVDEGATWRIFPAGIAPVVTGGPFYGLGAVVVGTISSAAWAIGVGERALSEIREVARAGRARMGSTPMVEQMTFQRELGFHSTALESVRVLCKSSYGAAVAGSAAGVRTDEFVRLLRDTKAAAKYVTEVGKAAVTWAWEQSGSVGMRNPNVLQRCFRDIYMGAGHMVFDDRNYLELAKAQLGLDTAGF